MKVIVLGGGASGMMAALTAAEDPSNQVTLLERQSRLGRKLLATGNGRCNLSNLNTSVSHYHGEYPDFAAYALSFFPVEETLAFFHKLGLYTTAEPSGKVYPFSDQANSVLDVLRFALQNRGVHVICGCEVTSVEKKAGGYRLASQEQTYFADKLILACGGSAGGKLGGTEAGYRLLRSLGHSITPLSPSLVQVKTELGAIKGLKGVRADAGITLKRAGQTVATEEGEVQFTDFGVSGPAIFSISREAAKGGEQVLLLDLLRPMSEEETVSFLKCRRQSAAQLPLEDFLTGLLHNRLGRVLLSTMGYVMDRQSQTLTDDDLKKIAHIIKYYPIAVTGVMGLEQAQVTAGGVHTSEFDARSLESRKCPGLYVTGELFDIDGDCGGYNLQWAWSSGRLAGCLRKTGDKK